MAYIGPANSDQFKSMSTQTITGNGSATTFSLNTPVANSSEIRFVVNNVVQKPDVDYSASGTQLSTGSNVLAGSDAAYVVNVGAAVGSQTPSDGSVASYYRWTTATTMSDASMQISLVDDCTSTSDYYEAYAYQSNATSSTTFTIGDSGHTNLFYGYRIIT